MLWQADGSDELPPSSPIESWAKDEAEGATGRQKGRRGSTTASYTSSAMWSAAGSTPSTFLFDENEAGPREDGELQEAATTPSAEQSDPEETQEGRGRNPRSFVEKCDDVMSKHPYANTPSDCVTTPRKRSWAFSPVSEGRSRATQRLRLEEDVGNGAGMRLSSFHELAGNPWDGDENDRDRRRSIPAPVNMSTPRDAQPPLRNVVYHSGANMSGKAPTPHYASTVASSVHSYARGEPDEERAGRQSGRSITRYTARTTPRSAAPSRQYQDAMDMDEDEEEDDGDALLLSPSRLRAQKERSRKELEELDERRRELKKAILEADSGEERGRRMGSHPQWRGGYAPELMGHGRRGMQERPWGKAVDDLGGAGPVEDDESSEDESMNAVEAPPPLKQNARWSAVPNTKAWLFMEEQRARERHQRAPDREASWGATQPRASCAVEEGYPRHMEELEQDREDWTAKEAELEEIEQSGRGGQGGMRMDFGRMDWIGGGDPNRSGPVPGGAIPTVVAREEGITDMPVTVSDPHDDRWTVHFEDPETLLKGQSADFVRIVWWGAEPTVIFSVYNYKYTENGAINRHIEAAVSSMTTILTGETRFQVVPPDPEEGRKLSSRDLPFTWAIRGLSEAGAWEMVKIRVASSKGVTIITHPRSLNNPRWVCGLVGFLRPDEDAIKETVLGTLRSTYMLERLADLTRSNTVLSHIPEDRRVAHVLRSLEVKVTATKEGEYVANIYVLPPTDDMDAWREWADELRSCRFNAFLCGAGHARPAFWCAGCRGVDHETEGCFFPRMKGWKGPEAGSNSHTRLQIAGLMRGSVGRGRGGTQRGSTRGGAPQIWTELNGNRGTWNSLAGPSRAPRPPGRGNGRGGSAARGPRGLWRGHWSPAMRR